VRVESRAIERELLICGTPDSRCPERNWHRGPLASIWLARWINSVDGYLLLHGSATQCAHRQTGGNVVTAHRPPARSGDDGRNRGAGVGKKTQARERTGGELLSFPDGIGPEDRLPRAMG
jgi:hypothetical protein